MYWRARSEKFGDHIHVRLFVAEIPSHTFAGIGELTMRQPEWDDLQKRLDLETTEE